MTRLGVTKMTDGSPHAAVGKGVRGSSRPGPSEPESHAADEYPEQVTIRCTLCRQEITLRLIPRAIETRCPCCGLRFAYDAHLTRPRSAKVAQETVSEVEQLDRWLSGTPVPRRPKNNWELFCEYGRPYAPYAVALIAAFVMTGIAALYGLSRNAAIAAANRDLRSQVYDLTLERDSLADTLLGHRRAVEAASRSAADALAQRDTALQRLEIEQTLRVAAENDRDRYALRQSQIRLETEMLQAEVLVQQSREALQSEPRRSLAFASEAAQILRAHDHAVPLAAEQVLRDALARNGGRRLAGHQMAVETIAVSADGQWLLSGSCDHTARLWDLRHPDPSGTSVELKAHSQRVTAVTFTPDGRRAITGGRDGRIVLWDLTATDPAAKPVVLGTHAGPITAMAIAPNSRWLVTASEGAGQAAVAAWLWDLKVAAGKVSPLALGGHAGPVRCIAISADSRWAVLGSEDETARLFDLRNPIHQVVLKGHRGIVTTVAMNPDGRWMVTGSADNTARLWDLTQETPRSETLQGHEGWIESVAISHDSRWIATGSYDNTARLWDCRTNQVLKLDGHTGRVHTVAFTPDGRWLVTASYDRTIRLWNVQATNPAEHCVVLRGHEGPVSAIAISPDSRWLYSGSGDILGTNDPDVRIWELAFDDALASARSMIDPPGEAAITREARGHLPTETDLR